MTTTTSNNIKSVTVIHCWSAPRSRSTALLYSFEARGSDCIALDEPLYRQWLLERGDAVSRPYRQELIDGRPPKSQAAAESSSSSPAVLFQWKRELLSLEERLHDAASRLSDTTTNNNGVIFCKHMAKHAGLYDFEQETVGSSSSSSSSSETTIVLRHCHILLIRDPVAVLSSWGCASSVHGSNPTPDEVGIVPLLAIYSQLQSRQRQGNAQQQPATTTNTNNNTVVVLDADELIEHPEAVLQTLCERLQIEYKVWMMKWKAGPHLCDGPWASWWYHDVWKSSGWNTVSSSNKDDDDDNSHGTPTSTTTGVVTRRRYRTLHPSLMDSLRASLPAYQFLKTLTRRHQTRGPTSSSSTTTILYEDARNQELLVWIGAPGRGQLLPRDMASVSPWDSAVQGGDAVWEGLRVYRGKILHLDKHLRRLFKSAKAMGFERVHGKEEIVQAIFQTLAANGMRDGAHIRLTLTRGEKSTSSMNPKFNVYGTTLIVLAEWKPTQGATTYDNDKGVALISASQRRNSPNTVDSKIHHNNLINNILPKIQANLAGAADAIMLDVDGFVSETNATNLFLVDDGALYTPHADHCLPGITRQCVMELASNELHIPVVERRLSLAEFHSADEVFTTGTMGELTPVVMIDGRVIGSGQRGPVTAQLQAMYRTLPDRDECATALPEFEAFVMD